MFASRAIAQTHEFTTGGVVRRYSLIAPSDADLGALPVVVDLHGSGSNPHEHLEVTEAATSAARGALVVLPWAGIPFRLLEGWPAGWAWNVPGNPLPGETVVREEPDDVAFIGALIERLVQHHAVDAHRIHLRGYSGGARLCSHLLARIPGQLRSVCCVGGVRFVPPSSAAALPPVLAVHGCKDTFNPYAGGSGPRWSESVESAVQQWAATMYCEPAPRMDAPADGVLEARYVDPAGLGAVRLISVVAAGHSWPGTQHVDHIAQFGDPGAFSASHAHWDFVQEVETDSAGVTIQVTGC